MYRHQLVHSCQVYCCPIHLYLPYLILPSPFVHHEPSVRPANTRYKYRMRTMCAFHYRRSVNRKWLTMLFSTRIQLSAEASQDTDRCIRAVEEAVSVLLCLPFYCLFTSFDAPHRAPHSARPRDVFVLTNTFLMCDDARSWVRQVGGLKWGFLLGKHRFLYFSKKWVYSIVLMFRVFQI